MNPFLFSIKFINMHIIHRKTSKMVHYIMLLITRCTASIQTKYINLVTNAVTTATPVNGLFFRTTWVSQYQRGKTSLDLNEARDDGVLGCSGISGTICKQSAPHSRQITTPTPHHLIFTGRMLFLMPNQQCQSTEGTSTEGTVLSN